MIKVSYASAVTLASMCTVATAWSEDGDQCAAEQTLAFDHGQHTYNFDLVEKKRSRWRSSLAEPSSADDVCIAAEDDDAGVSLVQLQTIQQTAQVAYSTFHESGTVSITFEKN